jgi:uncharacterized coiled-coil protein SlyX
MAVNELEQKVEVLESRIIELEKVNAFQEEEAKDYVTKDEAKLEVISNK